MTLGTDYGEIQVLSRAVRYGENVMFLEMRQAQDQESHALACLLVCDLCFPRQAHIQDAASKPAKAR